MHPIVQKKAYEVPSIEDHGPVNDLTATGGIFKRCGSAPHNKAQYRPSRKRAKRRIANIISKLFG